MVIFFGFFLKILKEAGVIANVPSKDCLFLPETNAYVEFLKNQELKKIELKERGVCFAAGGHLRRDGSRDGRYNKRYLEQYKEP